MYRNVLVYIDHTRQFRLGTWALECHRKYIANKEPLLAIEQPVCQWKKF